MSAVKKAFLFFRGGAFSSLQFPESKVRTKGQKKREHFAFKVFRKKKT